MALMPTGATPKGEAQVWPNSSTLWLRLDTSTITLVLKPYWLKLARLPCKETQSSAAPEM